MSVIFLYVAIYLLIALIFTQWMEKQYKKRGLPWDNISAAITMVIFPINIIMFILAFIAFIVRGIFNVFR